MDEIKYIYITCDNDKFKQATRLRFSILFEPYNVIERYDYDEFDEVSLHLVVLNRDKVIAYSRMTNINEEGKITNVVVSSEYLNRGIGFQMMRRHINKAKELKIDKLYLNARLKTIKFYEKVGFKCEGNVVISEKSGLALQKMCIKIKICYTK
ncbi:GNAT family N-acetyltransferase [Clostridium sp. SHJSY1]|uniref:GNAT family N-acetyltransferase n=1 Tax=Clostridium sp. SHJSY1 TaxID=2942483 RepID=UPI002876CAE5|nr:GNAT family N-acetyltransferase [Clostridium sp. SHJSY1]MDS0527799.1 GNAT family N-acetyltransferase [Clostridium sp. SHJSY1]